MREPRSAATTSNIKLAAIHTPATPMPTQKTCTTADASEYNNDVDELKTARAQTSSVTLGTAPVREARCAATATDIKFVAPHTASPPTPTQETCTTTTEKTNEIAALWTTRTQEAGGAHKTTTPVQETRSAAAAEANEVAALWTMRTQEASAVL